MACQRNTAILAQNQQKPKEKPNNTNKKQPKTMKLSEPSFKEY